MEVCQSEFDILDVAAEAADLHDKYVIAPADIGPNNIVFVFKTPYINYL